MNTSWYPPRHFARWLLCSTALKQAVRLDLLHYFSLQNAFGILNKVGASLTHTHTHTTTNNTYLPEKEKSCCLKKSGGLKLSVEISSHGCLGTKKFNCREMQSLKQSNTIILGVKYKATAILDCKEIGFLKQSKAIQSIWAWSTKQLQFWTAKK